MGRIEGERIHRPVIQQPKHEPKTGADQKANHPLPAARKGDYELHGQQRRDRIERLYGAGAASVSTMNDVRLMTATHKADKARRQTFDKEFAAFENYKKGGAAAGYTGAKSYVEVAQRADDAYRGELRKAGFKTSDVHGNSNVKAADFLNAEANRPGNLSTLSAEQVRLRVQSGKEPKYLVRLVQNRHMDRMNTTTGRHDAEWSNKSPVWVAAAEEIAGAKGDLFEVMKRIGYKDTYIAEVRQNIEDSKNGVIKPGENGYARLEDYSLAVTETDGVKGLTRPTWDTMLGKVKGNPDYSNFDFTDSDFVEKVTNFEHNGGDYDFHRTQMKDLKIKNAGDYIIAAGIPSDKADAFEARFRIEDDYNANQLFTGDVTTKRDDGQNRGVGVPERFIDNNWVGEQPRTSFLPVSDTGLSTGATPLEVRSQIGNIVDVPRTQTLGSEIRGGSLAGAGISAAFSLREVFDQTSKGNYRNAAQILATNTGTGALVGGVSSAGERFVSNGIERGLSNSATKLVTGGVARQVISRVAGSSIIGGAVNGGFSAYDQIGAYKRGEVTGSQAIGTITGEVGVGLAAGATGAAAGAAIGSIVPIAGTAIGAVVGFVGGVIIGMATDAAIRHGGYDKMVAHFVTDTIEAGKALPGEISGAVDKFADETTRGFTNIASGAVGTLGAIFG